MTPTTLDEARLPLDHAATLLAISDGLCKIGAARSDRSAGQFSIFNFLLRCAQEPEHRDDAARPAYVTMMQAGIVRRRAWFCRYWLPSDELPLRIEVPAAVPGGWQWWQDIEEIQRPPRTVPRLARNRRPPTRHPHQQLPDRPHLRRAVPLSTEVGASLVGARRGRAARRTFADVGPACQPARPTDLAPLPVIPAPLPVIPASSGNLISQSPFTGSSLRASQTHATSCVQQPPPRQDPPTPGAHKGRPYIRSRIRNCESGNGRLSGERTERP